MGKINDNLLGYINFYSYLYIVKKVNNFNKKVFENR